MLPNEHYEPHLAARITQAPDIGVHLHLHDQVTEGKETPLDICMRPEMQASFHTLRLRH